jgi:hypothetical protein
LIEGYGPLSFGVLMTTIVYHKETESFYADGRECTDGGMILHDTVKKIYELPNGDTVVCAGDCDVIKQVIDLWGTDFTIADFKLTEDMGCTMFVHYADKDIITHLSIWHGSNGPELYESEIDYTSTQGSGAEFALAALDFGQDAASAIEYAATRDSRTGTSVYMVALKRGGTHADKD